MKVKPTHYIYMKLSFHHFLTECDTAADRECRKVNHVRIPRPVLQTDLMSTIQLGHCVEDE